MKNKLLILVACFTQTAFGQNKEATTQDFVNLSKEMCSCVNESVKGMSAGMLNIFETYADDPAQMEEKVIEYAENNPDVAMRDMEKLEVAGVKIDECTVDLEAKYDKLYTDYSEEEVQVKILEIMSSKKECRLTVALFKMGESSEYEDE